MKLFSILSKWVVSGNAGITLEISVHSPSDSEHFFKNRRYDSFEWTRDDCLTDPVAARNFLARRDVEGTDWCHSWREGRQLPLRNWCDMHCAAKLKFFGSLLMINSKLPEAPIVTALLIRRQYNRLFSRSTMSRLLQALPRLEEINYESWIHPHPAMKENIDNGTVYPLISLFLLLLTYLVDEQIFGQELPAGLKRLSIFKDWDSIILDDSESFTNLSQSVALALVRGSKNLEHFSSCFQVEAKDFLHSPLSSKRWQWQNLKTLSLTSALMNPTERNKDIISLLRDAAASLSRMPRLKTMELWNADKGHAAVFQYEVLGDHTAITWKSSWCFHMTPELVGFWEQMASKYTRLQLTRVVCTSTLPTPDHSYGSVLEHLKLLQKILHPVSSFQIQWEAQNPQTWFT